MPLAGLRAAQLGRQRRPDPRFEQRPVRSVLLRQNNPVPVRFGDQARLRGPGQVPALTGPSGALRAAGEAAGLIEDDSMVSIANVEGQLRASSIRRIADLVEKHPEESLAIVRGWMQQEAA